MLKPPMPPKGPPAPGAKPAGKRPFNPAEQQARVDALRKGRRAPPAPVPGAHPGMPEEC